MKLGTYKNLVVKRPNTEVTKAELDQSIINLQRKNGVFYHVDERPAQLGDVVVLNYEGFIDGKPFLGGKATHHRLVLGEGKFIPGFEEQILGHFMGEVFQIRVTFPMNYANSHVAGKDAIFETELVFMGWEEIPEFDDDFALDFSTFETAAELKDSLMVSLQAKKEANEEERIQEELLTQIIEDSVIPMEETLLEELAGEYFAEKEEELELQGMSMETYLKATHQTIEDIEYQCRKKARRSFEQTSVLQAIAIAEGIEVEVEELQDVIYAAAFYEEMDPMELLGAMDEEEVTGMKLQILCDKAMALVRENAVYI